ncbi:MAG: Gfo/Idh/MocA family oxidoreductase [Desulfosarcinaceae bacterium]
MHEHPKSSVLIVGERSVGALRDSWAYLRPIPHLQLGTAPCLPDDLSSWEVVLTAVGSLDEQEIERLSGFVRAGGGWLHFACPDEGDLPALLGVKSLPAGPACELRLQFTRPDHPLGLRLPEAFYVRQPYLALAVIDDRVKTILHADWKYRKSAVLVERAHGEGRAACTTLQVLDHPVLQQIVYRLILRLARKDPGDRRLGVGILGYAPSMGRFHGEGCAQTPGLELQAACDLDPRRRRQAAEEFAQIKTYETAADLGRDPRVDLVIIATPPNTHADLALQMMATGKHVVCEKPLALTRAQAEAMSKAASNQGVHLSCHQNRRWDVDYLAIRQALAEDLIGELFYLETFVGGFTHPCSFWHSEAAVSGGTTFDWGGHYIDWIVSLFPGRVRTVTGTRHKRVWHDVTNADQERIQIRFGDGREAEFMHSDIAAARKPKWYLLGTRGAMVGQWQDVTGYQVDPLHYFQRHDFPATEMPPDLTVFRRDAAGKTTMMKPAPPDRPVFGFHHNLADHLITGEPLVAPLEDAVRVVAILEAAARSMNNGGRLETLNV